MKALLTKGGRIKNKHLLDFELIAHHSTLDKHLLHFELIAHFGSF